LFPNRGLLAGKGQEGALAFIRHKKEEGDLKPQKPERKGKIKKKRKRV